MIFIPNGVLPPIEGGACDVQNQLAVVLAAPFTRAPYVVLNGGLCDQAIQAFGLWRLMHIRQLGYLHDPMVTDVTTSTLAQRFPHRRFVHVLDVCALLTLMCRNNGISGGMRATARLAALTHDALTPAGGDTIKLIDPAAFDEDACYPELLEHYDGSALTSRHDINPALLIATVQGAGVLGTLLDIADKLAYVSRDLDCYLSRYAPDGLATHPEAYERFAALVATHGAVCDVWDAVGVEDGRVIVYDAERLANFLEVRALLFREFYLHPDARRRAFLIAHTVAKFLYKTGELSREDFLRMTDDDLDARIAHTIGIKTLANGWNGLKYTSHCEIFPTILEARTRERELLERGTTFTLVEDLSTLVKPATHYLVAHARGDAIPLTEALPQRATDIHAICAIPKPIRLYWIEHPPFDPSFLTALHAWRMRP